MKYFVLLYLIIYQTQAQILGKIRDSKGIIQAECNKNGSTYDICNGCFNIVRCFGFGVEVEQPCSSRSIKTPYCNQITNRCVGVNTCNQSFTMTCKYEGFFPNPVNCQQFLYCDGQEIEPQIYNCPPNTNYDHYKQRCSFIAECLTFLSENGLCLNNINQIVTYPLDGGIYVQCSPIGNQVKLETCEVWNQVLNLKTLLCELKSECKFEGIFRYNDTHFNICYLNGYELKQVGIKCNEGTEFEYFSKFCRAKKKSDKIFLTDANNIEEKEKLKINENYMPKIIQVLNKNDNHFMKSQEEIGEDLIEEEEEEEEEEESDNETTRSAEQEIITDEFSGEKINESRSNDSLEQNHEDFFNEAEFEDGNHERGYLKENYDKKEDREGSFEGEGGDIEEIEIQ